ncbi:MAG: hypothetical protein RI907_3124 [Pseudomonadota bacterium]|jgi:uncharacterized protein YjeT (DUF2065 family)
MHFDHTGQPWRLLRRWGLRAVVLGWLLALQACIVVPCTTEVYDADCHIQTRQMRLEAVQIGMIGRCSNEGCAAVLVFVGATAAASAVVSGSIVVVGNVVYWLEKQGRCVRVVEPPR